MKFFNEKTMETLNERDVLDQTNETELLLINGGLGCSLGNEYQPNTGTSTPPYNEAANAAAIWGNVMTILWGSVNLSCTLW